MIDFWLLIAKFGFLGLLYIFIIWMFVVILRDRGRGEKVSQPKLRVELISGPSGPKIFDLTGVVSIGRLSENEIQLSDNTVSAHHARVFYSQDQWLIEDLKSRNGTYVNGARIDTHTRLSTGDQIKIGQHVLKVS